MSEKWVEFGWQGISSYVPADWDIAKATGDERKGYLRMDDARMARWEVRWEQEKKRIALKVIFERFLRKVKGSLGRKAVKEFQYRRDLKMLPPENFKEKEVLSFNWETGKLHAIGLIWRCNRCSRILLTQIFSEHKQEAAVLGRRVLRSLEDHPVGGKALWSAYGFSFKLPEDYHLIDYALHGDLIKFSFFSVEGKGCLEIKRYNLASEVLNGRPLRNWFNAVYEETKAKDAEKIVEAGELNGHELLKWEREKKRSKKRFLERTARISYICYFTWHCSHSNRIILVEFTSPCEEKNDRGALLKEFHCHK